ncbi:MAG: hypothetical protein N2D54_01900 [Chloroflexota bacterium]
MRDGVSAFFVSGFGGGNHVERAARAAKAVLAVTGHTEESEPWVPVGVHTGVAYVGAVGQVDKVADITVLGDVANAASRLASIARVGEIIEDGNASKGTGVGCMAVFGKVQAILTGIKNVNKMPKNDFVR